jgi:hypothetical protein
VFRVSVDRSNNGNSRTIVIVTAPWLIDDDTCEGNRPNHRLLQQAVATEPTPYKGLIQHVKLAPERKE